MYCKYVLYSGAAPQCVIVRSIPSHTQLNFFPRLERHVLTSSLVNNSGEMPMLPPSLL